MAEGDTILRTARRIEAALGGRRLAVRAPNPRGRAAGVERIDGALLERAEARGKHLLLHCGPLVLHSHLAMSGSWHLYRRGERWRRPPGAAWAVLGGGETEAVEFGGPTLRVLRAESLRRDPTLARLGPDILAPDLDLDLDLELELERLAREIVGGAPERDLGDALLDQTLVAGIGNIFKSESCFAARISPWRAVGDLGEDEVTAVLAAARELMLAAVAGGRRPHSVYRRAGRPCPVCGTPIASRGQGDANRATYWCTSCQAG
jgi:endonuclease-8